MHYLTWKPSYCCNSYITIFHLIQFVHALLKLVEKLHNNKSHSPGKENCIIKHSRIHRSENRMWFVNRYWLIIDTKILLGSSLTCWKNHLLVVNPLMKGAKMSGKSRCIISTSLFFLLSYENPFLVTVRHEIILWDFIWMKAFEVPCE